MAQYIPFASNVEVNGHTILSVVRAIPTYQTELEEVLARHGLENIRPEGWYPQLFWLNAFRQIGENYRADVLFSIGKAIPENAIFPFNMVTVQDALSSINIAYHINHRGGEIGYYKLTEYSHERQSATMECRNPYPSHFDRGIISAMVEKFSSKNSVDVYLDSLFPTRLNGADSCTYRVSW